MSNTKIGLISDTHGLLRPEALQALQGIDFLLHAGDVGKPNVLPPLQEIAPMKTVRGNVDYGSWARKIPMTEVVEIAGITIYMIHILEHMDLDPAAAGFDVVVYGHSHKPDISYKDDVLYFNPGSAGGKRFSLPVTVGLLEVRDGKLFPEIVHLEV